MTTLNNQDEIYLFNTQKPIANLGDTDLEQKDFREIVLGAKKEDGEQDLWLKLLDLATDLAKKRANEHDRNWLNLYLGRSKTFTKGKSPQKHNVVVPLIPRCYATPDRDPAQAVEVPEGWLYIIRKFESPQGQAIELWRELKSDGLGNFSDVNLKRFKGKDQRTATGQPGFRIIVPYCIDKEVHDLWIAYSEVQWSWSRVQSLKKDTDLRNRRMHKLDLSDCLKSFANSNYTAPPMQGEKKDKPAITSTFGSIPPGNPKPAPGTATKGDAENPKEDLPIFDLDEVLVQAVRNTAELYNLKSAPDPESKSLAKSFKEPIPVVYLDNPIGIGRRLAGEYQQQWQKMETLLNDLRSIPERISHPSFVAPESLNDDLQKRFGVDRWFEAAALANRYFYSRISIEIPPGVKDKDAYKKRLTEIEEQFIQYQNKLDKTAIEQAIKVPQRRDIRKELVQARDKLVDFLEKELAAIKSKDTEGETQDPPLVLALDDYFTLTPLGDWERKQNPTDAVGDKSTPRWRDNYLDGWGAVYNLMALLGKHEYSIDADLEANPPDGWNWRRNNPAFELLRKLADPEGGSPLHSRLFPKPAAGDTLKIDAAKVEDTATAYKIQYFNNFKKLNQRDGDICKGLNLFGSNFNELMAMRDKNDPAYEKSLERSQNSVLRLIEGAFRLEFQETEKSLVELIAEAEKQLEGKMDEGIPAKEAFLKFAGFLKKTIDTADKDPTFAQPVRKELRNIRVRGIEIVEPDRLRRLLYDLSDDKFVSSGLGGILGLVEIHNFNKALKAFSSNKNPERDWELFAPLAASFLKIPSAIKDAKNAAVAVGNVAGEGTTDFGQKVLREKGVAEITAKAKAAKIFAAASVIGDLIDIGVTLSSFTENLAQNDDAAVADAIGFAGATLGIIGTVFSIPVLGWVAGLVGIAAWLAKAFLFKEDTPVEIWIANSPFARGEEYHDQFSYHRSSTITKIRDAKGKWVDTACTVHEYGSFRFLVDRKGTLVYAGVAPPSATAIAGYGLYIPGTMENLSPCKVAPNGNVYLKADPEKSIQADTHVATVGQPFEMHRLLKPHVKKEPISTQKAKGKAIAWHSPHDAYLALADALYRPRVTLTEFKTHADNKCALKVKLPFYLPGKSRLFIEFGEANQTLGTFGPGSIKNLKIGSSEYELIEQFPYWETKSFTAKVRLELLGKGDVQLPHEPLFDDANIETRIDEHTNKGVQSCTETKWIVADKKITGKAKTHSKLEAYVDILIDNIKNTF